MTPEEILRLSADRADENGHYKNIFGGEIFIDKDGKCFFIKKTLHENEK